MPRFALIIEYDGGPFVGWQRQENGVSIQQRLEEAVAALESGARRVVHGAGRTDAGVHALGQVAHVDLTRDWRADRLRDAINAHLRPDPIAVLEARGVAEGFEARFSAVRRHYRYIIDNRRAPLTLQRGRMWHVKRPLDAAAMHAAAQLLVGRHDFTTFRSTECQAESPIRTLERLDVRREGSLIEITTSARSFLHNQVRSLAGSLEHVGSGRWSAADLRAALEARERARCGQVAPPHGLYLVAVDY
ncbi:MULTISPECIES: tRNA pseudouridine(38-40) synthase TruA [Methylosinus]|uniref:tRNA pseudouridine synthase A n=1 Tax=Methylosinus trichosporium (strain ATCC 35070 / NCIMB 11131 / UNIQEM 75 / OB3b) TaxID=595536 RepID=A0A2D2D457_METT3|nr:MULTISPECIES: tRNA pseudouridine(38-40) synthase TruA [Methylosinus]ATQ69767.1 tRNA pseudouridine(38-40) synthase TruA [Methylosinus trichosporium OB3b]OBS52434.1 tRNA pseudouridine(38,39,40) synthase TruA [Methylosinus sp. 3S-1]